MYKKLYKNFSLQLCLGFLYINICFFYGNNKEKTVDQANENMWNKFSSIISYSKEYHNNIKDNNNNLVAKRSNDYGSLSIYQFYDENTIINNKTLDTDKDLFGHNSYVFFNTNMNNEVYQILFIFNYSHKKNFKTILPKYLIANIHHVNKKLTILKPIDNFHINSLFEHQLYPYGFFFYDQSMDSKYINRSVNFDPIIIEENTPIEEEKKIIYDNKELNHDDKVSLQPINETNPDITNNLVKNSDNLNNKDLSPMDQEIYIFKFFLQDPDFTQSKAAPKVLNVYVNKNGIVIKMEIVQTFISENFYAINFLKNWFLRIFSKGKLMENNDDFYDLNDFILTNPLWELRIGVLSKNHFVDNCKDNFIMILCFLDTVNNIILNTRFLNKCCSAKSLNLL